MTQAIHNKIEGCAYKQPKFLFVSLTTGAAVRASSTNIKVTSATFYGVKAVSATAAPTDNTDAVRLGYTDATGASGVTAGQPAFTTVTIDQGLYVSQSSVTGSCFDLNDVWFLGSTNDKVLIVYEQ
jgi:hypothetical protein